MVMEQIAYRVELSGVWVLMPPSSIIQRELPSNHLKTTRHMFSTKSTHELVSLFIAVPVLSTAVGYPYNNTASNTQFQTIGLAFMQSYVW